MAGIKRVLISVFFSNFLALNAQSDHYSNDVLSGFADGLCSCIEEYSKSTENIEELLFSGYNHCASSYMLNNQHLLIDWVQNHIGKSSLSNSAGRTQAIQIASTELLRQGNPVIARECRIYREQLEAYKVIFFQETLGYTANSEQVMTAIMAMEEVLPTISDPDNQTLAYNLLGMLYEFIEDKEMARTYYSKSINLGGKNNFIAAFLLAILPE
ncbi:MAG: hypothetical protein R2795_03735 [Saprospiraceae bacterium]